MNDRNLAIILAALRIAQLSLDDLNAMPQMEGQPPVTTEEIENLCETLNTEE